MRIALRQLHYFRALARARHYGHAARLVAVTGTLHSELREEANDSAIRAFPLPIGAVETLAEIAREVADLIPRLMVGTASLSYD